MCTRLFTRVAANDRFRVAALGLPLDAKWARAVGLESERHHILRSGTP
jgi:hypothetical protein